MHCCFAFRRVRILRNQVLLTMFAFILLHQRDMVILLMARRLAYAFAELSTMIQRLEKKILPKLVSVVTSCAMLNLEIRSKSQVHLER